MQDAITATAVPHVYTLSDLKLFNDDFRNCYYDLGAIMIEEGPFDLILTDPPYIKKLVPIYADLAKFASEVLSDNGCLVTIVGHYNLPEYIKLMEPYLDYWWIMTVIHQTGNGRWNAFPMNYKKVIPTFKPMLWFVRKGCRYKGKYINDSVQSVKPKKEYHPWQQSTIEFDHVISRLTEIGDKVLDPFMGSGTVGVSAISLGRKFYGIEMNGDTFKIAENRLSLVQKQQVIPTYNR